MKTLTAALVVLITTTVFAQDPLFGRQWSLANVGQPLFRVTGELTRQTVTGQPGIDMGWPGVLVAPPGGADVVIAILDSGIDPGHPEFAGRESSLHCTASLAPFPTRMSGARMRHILGPQRFFS